MWISISLKKILTMEVEINESSLFACASAKRKDKTICSQGEICFIFITTGNQ